MTILEAIVQHKRQEIAARKNETAISSLMSMEHFSRQSFSLKKALTETDPFAVIAEIKRSSPSAGELNRNVDPARIGKAYEENGAAAISVLTDGKYFNGSLEDLEAVRRVTTIPLLRKEFIINDYQIFEAKAYGADAILLIAGIVEYSHLQELFLAAHELKLECLVEIYEEREIDKLNFDLMKIVGINNRNLHTLQVDIGRTLTMAYRIPPDVTLVSESGIHTAADLKKLSSAGIQAALIGEYFMKSEHPGVTLKNMLDDFQNERTD
jgi:indole-3-glycerol phosphate synthase